MALIRWNSFTSSHPRSFLVDGIVAGPRTQLSYEVMHRLVEETHPIGAYALRPTDGIVQVRFEQVSDAQKFADRVQARQVGGECSENPYWAFGLDTERFAGTLARSGTTGRRPAARKVRELPF